MPTPANQWYDVGVVKATNMLVTHYYVPTDGSTQSNGDAAPVSSTSVSGTRAS